MNSKKLLERKIVVNSEMFFDELKFLQSKQEVQDVERTLRVSNDTGENKVGFKFCDTNTKTNVTVSYTMNNCYPDVVYHFNPFKENEQLKDVVVNVPIIFRTNHLKSVLNQMKYIITNKLWLKKGDDYILVHSLDDELNESEVYISEVDNVCLPDEYDKFGVKLKFKSISSDKEITKTIYKVKDYYTTNSFGIERVYSLNKEAKILPFNSYYDLIVVERDDGSHVYDVKYRYSALESVLPNQLKLDKEGNEEFMDKNALLFRLCQTLFPKLVIPDFINRIKALFMLENVSYPIEFEYDLNSKSMKFILKYSVGDVVIHASDSIPMEEHSFLNGFIKMYEMCEMYFNREEHHICPKTKLSDI